MRSEGQGLQSVPVQEEAGLLHSPVVKTPPCNERGCEFDPWSGSQDPTCLRVWPKSLKIIILKIKREAEKEVSFSVPHEDSGKRNVAARK